MTPEEKKVVLSRCDLFLRDTAEMLEAAHVQLEDGLTLRGYGEKSDGVRS